MTMVSLYVLKNWGVLRDVKNIRMKRLLPTLGLLIYGLHVLAQCPEGLLTGDKNLISNGDFEENEFSFATDYLQHPVADAGRFLIVSDAKTFCSCFVGTGDGKFLAVDGANGRNKIVWQQEIEVKENTTYFFSAWATNLYAIKPAILQFSINGALLDKPFQCPAKQNIWEQFFVNWHSGNTTKAIITVVSQNPDWNGNTLAWT